MPWVTHKQALGEGDLNFKPGCLTNLNIAAGSAPTVLSTAAHVYMHKFHVTNGIYYTVAYSIQSALIITSTPRAELGISSTV